MVSWSAGQVVTADDLTAITWQLVHQGTDQDVTSSTTLVDTALVVPVDGPTVVRANLRYGSGGGGIRWAWSASGSAGGRRFLWTYGPNGTNAEEGTFQARNFASGTTHQTPHFSGASTLAILEELDLDGEGEVTFQFAQDTSDASATTLDGDSWLRYVRVG